MRRAVFLALLLAACGGSTGDVAPAPACPNFRPFDAPPLSLETAREAHFWDALRTRFRFEERRSPGYLRRETRARLDAARRPDGTYCDADLYTAGRQLFEHDFTPADGLGRAAGVATEFRRVHEGSRGGPDATSCRSCHWRGGTAGAGAAVDNALFAGDGDHVSSADARNAPALHGVAVLDILGLEMSEALAALRRDAAAEARRSGASVEVRLVAKGVDFGALRVSPDGGVDTRAVEGVDGDLIVRPFGWKANQRRLRDVVEDSFDLHLGIQAPGRLARGTTDEVGEGPEDDPDGDGVVHELSDAQVTSVERFLAAGALPITRPPERLEDAEPGGTGLLPPFDIVFVEEWTHGRTLFDSVGCASCHVPSLPVSDPTHRSTDAAGVTHAFSLAEAAERPRLAADQGVYRAFLFSDLRRHDLGADNASPRVERGVARRQFRTAPLWGLADSAPYMHDGRAVTIDEAIRFHGGEAEAARDAYLALSVKDAGHLRVFLISLRRELRWLVPG